MLVNFKQQGPMQTVLMKHWQSDQQSAPAPSFDNGNTAKEVANETSAGTYAHMGSPIAAETMPAVARAAYQDSIQL